MRDFNPPPPPSPELSEEGAKKPWRKPQIRLVRFGITLGAPRVGTFAADEHPLGFQEGTYDPNIS